MSLLKGVRVVEMGLWVAGPASAGILADWGAEVVKLEMPSGDPMRRLYGAVYGLDEDRCPPFELYNRGKRSVAVDVNQPDGLALIKRLIATADVFVTNMRPKFLERVGLDYATLSVAQPGLVYASLTAYGLTGPDCDAPGYDMAAYSGRSGIAERATPPGAEPPVLPGGLGDNVSAITMAIRALPTSLAATQASSSHHSARARRKKARPTSCRSLRSWFSARRKAMRAAR